MFNIITGNLPDKFQGVKIKTDFKQGFKFFKILDDNKLDQQDKALLIMKCLFFSNPPNVNNLWDFINNYIAGGEKGEGTGEKTVDFNQDAGRIYTAFWQVYNIDLRTIDLHWWQFLELFKNLPDGTTLSRVIEIRTKDIDKSMDAKTKAKLMNLKATYMIKSNETFKPSF
jgi:hypothetical protein